MTRSVPVLFVTLALAAAACSSTDGDDGGSASDDTTIEDVLGDPGDCLVVDLSVSPEKIDLLTDLARTFNASSEAEVDGECVFVRPQSKSSGLGATLLTEGWDEEAEGPRPVVWSPASSAWGAILDQRLAEQGEPPIAGRGHAVHAHAAGHRHAPADGRSPGLARRAHRLRATSSNCPPAVRAGPPSATPSGARSGSARPTPTSRPAGCPPSSPRTTRPRARPKG